MGRLGLVVVLVLAGCGGEGGGGTAVAAVDTVQGVERWSYAAERGPRLDWALDTVGVLGDAFAEDAYQFDDVTREGLAADGAGNLYVLDRQGSRVLKYDPEGRHLSTYGRQGEGPGELGQPLGLGVGPGDTVWVSDFSNTRLTGYPQDGGAPRMISYGENAGVPSPALAALDDGFVQTLRPLINFRGGPGGIRRTGADGSDADETAPPRIPLVRLDPDLALMDTLWSVPEPPTDMVQLEAGTQMMILMMSRQFSPPLRWQALSDGTVVVSDSAAYLIRLVAPDGSVRRLIQRDPDPRPTTQSDRDRARERVREEESGGGTRISMGGGGGGQMQEQLLEQRLEKMTFAPIIPRIVALHVDPNDRIWVGVTEDVADSIARIDIYERTGELVGELRDFPMPDVFLAPDRMGILRRDDLDVQQVVLVRRERD